MRRSVKDTATFPPHPPATSHWVAHLISSVKPAIVKICLGALPFHHIQAGVDTIGIDDELTMTAFPNSPKGGNESIKKVKR